jgi:hypothetical protein
MCIVSGVGDIPRHGMLGWRGKMDILDEYRWFDKASANVAKPLLKVSSDATKKAMRFHGTDYLIQEKEGSNLHYFFNKKKQKVRVLIPEEKEDAESH